jgi:ribosomal protein L11 methyltransferase
VIRLAVRVAREQAERVLAELLELAPAGVEEVELEDGRVEYAVYGAPGELPALPELHALVAGTPVEVSTTEVADDWAERWREFHRPVLVEPPRGADLPALRVRPPWEPAAAADEAPHGPGTIELVIDPGQAFGTGAHASTRLCLELLLELRAAAPEPAAALDVGTGSGVLAIAAAKLGYGPLLGLDNEAESVSAAAENAAVNGVALATRRFDLRREPLPWAGTGEPAPPGRPVVVLANLLAPLLRDLSAAIATPPAALIAGGLLAEQLDEAAAGIAAALGLSERARGVAEGWGALWLGPA